MSIEDWDAPTKEDLREDAPVDYDKDIEETQNHIVLSERRECVRNINRMPRRRKNGEQ